jgi:preprotein translocase subunit SecD
LGYFNANYPTLGLTIGYPEAAGRDGTVAICQVTVLAPDPTGEAPEKGPARPRPRLAFRWVAPEGAGKGADVELLPDLSNPAAAPLPVLREVLLNERDVARVFPTQSQQGEMVIGVEMTEDGARRMTALTTANIGRRLAIVVDGQVVFAAIVRGVISNSMVIDYGGDADPALLRSTLGRIQTAMFSLP